MMAASKAGIEDVSEGDMATLVYCAPDAANRGMRQWLDGTVPSSSDAGWV